MLRDAAIFLALVAALFFATGGIVLLPFRRTFPSVSGGAKVVIGGAAVAVALAIFIVFARQSARWPIWLALLGAALVFTALHLTGRDLMIKERQSMKIIIGAAVAGAYLTFAFGLASRVVRLEGSLASLERWVTEPVTFLVVMTAAVLVVEPLDRSVLPRYREFLLRRRVRS